MNKNVFPGLKFGAACALFLAGLFTAKSLAQTPDQTAWKILEGGVTQPKSTEKIAALRALSLVTRNPRALRLAENALADPKPQVRIAAATALGQMQSPSAANKLKEALNDNDLHVVMAAAHALAQLKDPACYDVYYAVLTGERKNNESFIAQQTAVLHDPKQMATMGFNEGIGYVPFASIPWSAVETIRKSRKDDTSAKAAVILALANDPDAKTADALVKESQDNNWVLRVAALEAIAKRGDPALLPKIQDSLNDPKDQVKYTTAAAVAHLTAVASVHKTAGVKH